MMTNPSTLRRTAAILLALTLTLVVAACGGDDDNTGTATATATTAAERGVFPTTIEHALGSTTIESPPERVVTVGLKDQDSLLALGVKAVGAMDWFQDDTFAKWPWEAAAWGGTPPEIVSDSGFNINYEKVAAQRPDLILALYAELKRGEYEKLSKIAPTVAQHPDHAPYTTPWRVDTLTAAQAVGKTAQAKQLIADVDAQFAKVRKEHPEFHGKTAVMIDPSEGFYAFASSDPRGQFLTELGFDKAPEVDAAAKGNFGVDMSQERLDLLDVDYLFLLVDDAVKPRLEKNAAFQALDVVKDGRAIELPYYDPPQYGAAVAFNTVQSIPYAIDGTLKQIAAAEGKAS